MAINQAVLFSKPLYHLDISLTYEELNFEIQKFLQDHDIYIRSYKKIDGKNLESRKILNKHYGIYDYASSIDSIKDLIISNKAKTIFENKYKIEWEKAVELKKIDTIKNFKRRFNLSSENIAELWNDKNNNQVIKIQAGLVISYIHNLDIFLMNGFFPLMIDLFYNQNFIMNYYVIEFDSDKLKWSEFRKNILGITNCSKSSKDSFRGLMYKKYKINDPVTNNFVHGSAGPFEGMIERIIHEENFSFSTNPIGVYLLSRNMTQEQFNKWFQKQSIEKKSFIFDETEEKNSNQIIDFLNETLFV